MPDLDPHTWVALALVLALPFLYLRSRARWRNLE
jgi:hypothetical protein